MSLPDGPRLAVLINGSAGAVERRGGQATTELVKAAFAAHGIAAEIQLLPSAGIGSATERAVEKAADRELDAVVVGGGDGSVRTVARVLAGTGIPLGIIPLGTLNHFGRDLGIPIDIAQAIAVVAAGNVRRTDVGEMNGEVFINNSSIGIYPYLVLERERRRRGARISKWASMIAALPRVLRNLPVFRLRIRLEHEAEQCRSTCVLVGNNEYRIGMPTFGTRTALDRGELCLYVARAQSRLGLLWIGFRCILGIVDQQRDLRILKAATAEIRARRRRLLVAFDGEVQSIRLPLRYRIRPGALRVFAPANK